eukprot:105824-Chlamydomonas_euryale.AAC.6
MVDQCDVQHPSHQVATIEGGRRCNCAQYRAGDMTRNHCAHVQERDGSVASFHARGGGVAVTRSSRPVYVLSTWLSTQPHWCADKEGAATVTQTPGRGDGGHSPVAGSACGASCCRVCTRVTHVWPV